AALPPARSVTYQQIITGALDAQFVELFGVVRYCSPPETNDPSWRITVAVGGGTLPVRVGAAPDPQIEGDAQVRGQTLCLYQFNRNRQVLSPVLQVPRGVPERIEKRAPQNPFATPVRSGAGMLQFTTDIPTGHRIHARGIVTRSQPGSSVWIRDES